MKPFTLLQTQIIKDLIKKYTQDEPGYNGSQVVEFLSDIGYSADRSTLNCFKRNDRNRDSFVIIHTKTSKSLEFRPWE